MKHTGADVDNLARKKSSELVRTPIICENVSAGVTKHIVQEVNQSLIIRNPGRYLEGVGG